jgi:ribokinase
MARGADDEEQIVVLGQATRDLVLRVTAIPDVGESAFVEQRIERMGGKGANQAVGLRQLCPGRVTIIVIAVVGTDPAGDLVLGDAAGSGLDIEWIIRRGRTALIVDLVDPDGSRRLLEDVPPESLLTERDVAAAGEAVRSADFVVLQLQQPTGALLAAARIAAEAGSQIVLDGGIEGAARDELLGMAHVVRANAREASQLTGVKIVTLDDALAAASEVLSHGPTVVALEVPDEGNLVAWPSGHRLYPYGDAGEVVDRTGAGDAFVAGLVAGLRRGDEPADAGQLAADAASSTVQRLGGRPELAQLARGQGRRS